MVRPCSCPASKRSWARGTKDKEHATSQTPNTAIAVIGIDIGKNSFHVVGHDARGAIVLRQKWSRGQVEARLANIPPCLIGMEACVGAHHHDQIAIAPASASAPNCPRVPSLEAFGRRPPCKPNRRDGPSSETLHNSGHGRIR
jgi:hypothetical protein